MPLTSIKKAASNKDSMNEFQDLKTSRKKRLSLPNTCDSSTVATEGKARRRQSLRRQSIASFKAEQKKKREMAAKENAVPPQFSPPETRSASRKKQRRDAPEQKGIILSFSPPNQKENARREAEEAKRKEEDRRGRVQATREKGNLLVYSPSNRPVHFRESFDPSLPDPTGQHVAVPLGSALSNADTDTSNLTESEAGAAGNNNTGTLDPQIKELLERMDGRIGEMVTSGKQQSTETELLAEKARAEALHATSQKLTAANQQLESQIQQLSEQHAAEREEFLVEKTRLEMQWSAAQEEVAKASTQLEEARSHLQDQVAGLTNDRQQLKEKIIALEKDLQATRDKLEETTKLLNALRSENATEKDSLANQYQELQGTNWDLTQQLHQSKESELRLEHKLETIQQSLDANLVQLEETTKELENARTTAEDREAQIAALETESREAMMFANELKEEIEALNRENATERANYQKLLSESNESTEKMSCELREKDQKIGELFEQLGEVQQGVQQERAAAAESMAKMDISKQRMEDQLQDLNTQLSEALRQAEHFKEKSTNFSDKLQQSENELEASKQLAKDVGEKNKLQLEGLTRELEELSQELESVEKDRDNISQQLQNVKALLEDATAVQESAKEQEQVTSSTLATVQESLASERRRREDLERRVRELERDLQATSEERDNARSNMLGFDEREDDLYRRLREGDRIRREMHGKLIQLMGNIRVFVRVRPALEREKKKKPRTAKVVDSKKRKHEDVSDNTEENPFRYPGVYDQNEKAASHTSSTSIYDATKNVIEVREPPKDRGGLKERRKTWKYAFDKVFSPNHGQQDVWDATEPLVQCAVDGFNVTIFAYGQTGSGKTYTMLGEPGNEGIVARSVRMLYDAKDEIETLSRGESNVSMSVELLEVYNEKVHDLLAPRNGPDGRLANLKVTSLEVVGNTVVATSSKEEVMEILSLAQSRRCVKATASNSESSRSHMLFTIHFEVTNKNGVTRTGKLNVCDLAGSERLGKSGTNLVGGSLFEETKNINKSLSVLSNVIERLQAGDKVIPFRDSKLTFLLKDSLSGNSKTLAIVCCNPLADHVSESVSSLRFAAKVNRVDLKAVANVSC